MAPTPAPTTAPTPASTEDERVERIAGRITAGARTAATPAPTGGLVNDGAGVILGAVAWALILNWLRYGTRGARGWISAKFINKPMGGPGGKPRGRGGRRLDEEEGD